MLNRYRARHDDQRGFVLVWMALLLVCLLVIAALAIEVGRWYAVRSKLQHYADTAALAGAVLMPDLVQASNAAFDNLARNGVCDRTSFNTTTRRCTGNGGATWAQVDPIPNDPSKVRVTVWQSVKNTLGALIGVYNTTVSRTAVAAYQGPLAMGSPINTLADQPIPEVGGTAWSAAASLQGQYWVGVHGYKTGKDSGDRFQAGKCGSSELCATTGSNGLNDGTIFGANNGAGEWDPNGYYYPVTIGAGKSGNLAIEIYDPAFVDAGQTCSDNGLPYTTSPAQTESGFVQTLYSNAAFCAGDNSIGGDTVETLFSVHGPDSTPTYTDNPLVTGGNCAPKQFGAFNGSNIKASLDSWVDPKSLMRLRAEFHKWVRVCTIPVNNPNTYPIQYLLHVSTALDYDMAGGKLVVDPTTTSRGGENMFAMRAGWVSGNSNTAPRLSGAAASDKLAVFAGGRLPIFMNIQGATTQFYLSEVKPGANGRTLQVDFWDTGDAGASGTIKLLPPTGATYKNSSGNTASLTAFTNCSLRTSSAAAVTTLTNCTVPISSAGNGKLISLYVPVPTDYACGTLPAQDCWIRAVFDYPSGTDVHDFTTWASNINGDPTRITE